MDSLLFPKNALCQFFSFYAAWLHGKVNTVFTYSTTNPCLDDIKSLQSCLDDTGYNFFNISIILLNFTLILQSIDKKKKR